MKFVIQRVAHASVTVEEKVLGKIGNGFMVLIGVSETDNETIADKMVQKLINMRIFQYISILLLVGAIGFIIYRNSPHYQIIKGNIFGTYYNIKIFSDKKDKNLKKIIETRFQEINSKMSVFDKSSEISQLNKFPAKKYLYQKTYLNIL